MAKGLTSSGTYVSVGTKIGKVGVTSLMTKCSRVVPVIGNIIGMIDEIHQEGRLKDLNQVTLSLKEGQSSLEGNLDIIKTSLNNSRVELEVVNKKLSNLEDLSSGEIKKLIHSRTELENEINNFKETRDYYSKELDKLKEVFLIIENKQSLQDGEIEKLKNISEDQKQSFREFQNTISKIEKDFSLLQNRTDEISQEVNLLKLKVEEIDQELSSIKKEFRHSNSKLEKLLLYTTLKIEREDLEKELASLLDIKVNKEHLFELWIDPTFPKDVLSDCKEGYLIPSDVYDYYADKHSKETMSGWTRCETFNEKVLDSLDSFNSSNSKYKEELIKKYLENTLLFNRIAKELNLNSISANKELIDNPKGSFQWIVWIILTLIGIVSIRIIWKNRKKLKRINKKFNRILLAMVILLPMSVIIFYLNRNTITTFSKENVTENVITSCIEDEHSNKTTSTIFHWIEVNVTAELNCFTGGFLTFEKYYDKLVKERSIRLNREVYYTNEEINIYFSKLWNNLKEKELYLRVFNQLCSKFLVELFNLAVEDYSSDKRLYRFKEKVEYKLINFIEDTVYYFYYRGIYLVIGDIPIKDLLFIQSSKRGREISNRWFTREMINNLEKYGLLGGGDG